MPGDGTDSKECDEAKSEANTREGHGGQAIERSEGGIWNHIVDIRNTVSIIATAIPKN